MVYWYAFELVLDLEILFILRQDLMAKYWQIGIFSDLFTNSEWTKPNFIYYICQQGPKASTLE